MECTCVKKEVGNGKYGVKGYVVTTLCDKCKAQQESDSIKAIEEKEQEDINLMIAEKIREMAKAELIKENKIQEIEGILKKRII